MDTISDKRSGVEYRSPGVRSLMRRPLWRSPVLFWPIAALRHRINLYSESYDLLVEGYPRSANTYAVHAIQLASGGRIAVRSHLHCPAAVLVALRHRKPVLLAIRQPDDAITAWTALSRYPLSYTVSAYIDFYEELVPHRRSLVVAKFGDITSNVDSVLCRLRDRYSLPFENALHGGSAVVFNSIDAEFRAKNGHVEENRVARPSEARSRAQAAVRSQLLGEEWSRMMSRARQIYERMLEP